MTAVDVPSSRSPTKELASELAARTCSRWPPSSGDSGTFPTLSTRLETRWRSTIRNPPRANPLYDPSRRVRRSNLEYERDPFPNNRIPAHRLDSVALKANREYPQPNTDVGPFFRNNYWSNPSERNTPDGFIARVDHNLGELQKVTLSINSSDGFRDGLDIYPTSANFARPDREFVSRSVRLADTVNVTPNITYRTAVNARSEIADTNSLLGDQNRPRDLGPARCQRQGLPSIPLPGLYRDGADPALLPSQCVGRL